MKNTTQEDAIRLVWLQLVKFGELLNLDCVKSDGGFDRGQNGTFRHYETTRLFSERELGAVLPFCKKIEDEIQKIPGVLPGSFCVGTFSQPPTGKRIKTARRLCRVAIFFELTVRALPREKRSSKG